MRLWIALPIMLAMTQAAVAQRAANMDLRTCPPGDPLCDSMRAQFAREYPLAWKGNYEAQRNVAFCFTTGCDGAVRRDPILGCALRFVILYSGSSKVDPSDTMNTHSCERMLTGIELAAAKTRAKVIFESIYGTRALRR